MAGVKGKSGGPRPNSGGKRINAGGARPGAGRPRKPKEPTEQIADRDMLQLLQDIALGKVKATTVQVRAAIAAVQYTHPKVGEGGKKQQKAAAAERVTGGGGRFVPRQPPRLIVDNGRK